jgi:dTDP-4-amino-4,6-dideoxygalactose transaminase
MRVPFLDLQAQYRSLREEILQALDRLGQRAEFTLGPEVEAFEQEFARFCGLRYAVAVNSGTSALHLALLAAGVGPGDEVITTPFTFFATVEAILYTGARPVFADIDPRTGNLDPGAVKRVLTERTRALLPVHLYGRPADMTALTELADRHGLALIEDACQAHGAAWDGKPVGSFGLAAAFSFYPTKNLGACGEGGAVVTDRAEIAERVRELRNHGQRERYRHERIGFNYRMEAFQAAILRIKLRWLRQWNEARYQLAALYRGRLAAARVELPVDDPRARVVYHVFAVGVEQRDRVRAELAARGVETAVYYPRPLHLEPACRPLGYGAGSFPEAERLAAQVLCLPLYPEMTREQAEYVAEAVRDVVGQR